MPATGTFPKVRPPGPGPVQGRERKQGRSIGRGPSAVSFVGGLSCHGQLPDLLTDGACCRRVRPHRCRRGLLLVTRGLCGVILSISRPRTFPSTRPMDHPPRLAVRVPPGGAARGVALHFGVLYAISTWLLLAPVEPSRRSAVSNSTRKSAPTSHWECTYCRTSPQDDEAQIWVRE